MKVLLLRFLVIFGAKAHKAFLSHKGCHLFKVGDKDINPEVELLTVE